MAEKSDLLRDTIGQLQEQLSAAGAIDPEVRRMLAEAVAEMQLTLHGLDQPATEQSAPTEEELGCSRSLADWMSQAARHFEASHPTLADTLSKIVDLLVQMGI